MRVLVTNDDGYDAVGLVAVAESLLAAGHEVTVGAPLTERSGSGSSLGTIEDGSRIPLFEKRIDALGNTPVYALDCPPALAAIAFCSGTFGPPPDLVVSGINPGHNTGRSVLFSSTVGAVLAARVAGISGLAISTGFAPGHRFDTAAEVARGLVQWFGARDSAADPLTLNVNVPELDFAALQGIRIADLGAKSMFTLRVARTDGDLVLRRVERSSGFASGTDGAAVVDGFVSVTPLSSVGADLGALSGDGLPALAAAIG
ncbi:5'/3'-nucleotidase SurE [Aldersonia sp. NBC_00410]|uniref:5'/3'-nucleotidase SurE n=1 Tax=Aldersonia sp. NBC_00410 TaxID=2975954 RepID=UPI002257B882|nr:5'/3'-nucleotidase SurE [Aldersonia sp. NBC_00410]MCX5046363.1 5'/3'-nucleotidase SurE [Aldersonia sp. NBC_00410]